MYVKAHIFYGKTILTETNRPFFVNYGHIKTKQKEKHLYNFCIINVIVNETTQIIFCVM